MNERMNERIKAIYACASVKASNFGHDSRWKTSGSATFSFATFCKKRESRPFPPLNRQCLLLLFLAWNQIYTKKWYTRHTYIKTKRKNTNMSVSTNEAKNKIRNSLAFVWFLRGVSWYFYVSLVNWPNTGTLLRTNCCRHSIMHKTISS